MAGFQVSINGRFWVSPEGEKLFSPQAWSRLTRRLELVPASEQAFIAEGPSGTCRYGSELADWAFDEARVWLGTSPDIGEFGRQLPKEEQTWAIIGIDHSANPKKVGLARGVFGPAIRGIRDVVVGVAWDEVHTKITQWIEEADNYLLAIDAPLGWPVALSAALPGHQAGLPLRNPPDRLFHRTTDEMVHRRLGKRPLEVGADRIARTAASALGLLERIRQETGEDLQLQWSRFRSSGVIEVYPAATLTARSLPAAGYKRRSDVNVEQRASLLVALGRELTLVPAPDDLVYTDDVFDACVCVAAGIDFLAGRAVEPEGMAELVRKEGWIWFQDPQSGR